MAKWSNAVITEKGKELMAKVLSGSEIVFTSIKTSDHKFLGDVNFEKVSVIPNIKQSEEIRSIEIINNKTVSIYSSFSNKELINGYEVRAIGLYALDPITQDEVLYSITTTTRPDYMPTFNGVTLSSIDYKFVTAVGNSENVVLDITDQTMVTKQEFNELADIVEIKSDTTYVNSRFDELSGTVVTDKIEPTINVGDQWHKEY